MNEDFAAAMRRATLSTSGSKVAEATRIIQDALAGQSFAGRRVSTVPDITPPFAKSGPTPFPVDPDADIVEPAEMPEAGSVPTSGLQHSRVRKPLGEVLRILREGRIATGAFGSLQGMNLPGMGKLAPPPAVPDGARFLARSFACAAGKRSYRLYIPASAPERPQGLVVMLHGCKQDPDDFAAGTGMNAVAEAHGLLVAYPGQTGADNASSCWNWFRPADQMRDVGEPSIIAGITEEIMSEFELDGSRVYIAGLSAGGAMAAVMGETYPDLYAAVGIHSGLAYGSANDVMSAFSAMRGEVGLTTRMKPPVATGGASRIRTIVFQGNADRTVHPSNARRIVAAASPADADPAVRKETGRAGGGRSYERTTVLERDGTPVVEYWLVEGAGHAWSGGQAAGSYTDPAGPDASREMVRFFLERK